MTALRQSRDRDPEAGSGSVLVVGGVAVVVVVLLASLAVVAAAVAAHRVRAAADLAALAASGSHWGVVTGVGMDPCSAAAQVAAANGAELVSCQVESEGVALVEASVPIALPWPGAPAVATARARAGPDAAADTP